MVAAVAENERDRIRERVRDAKRYRVTQRLYNGGKRPFGFDVVVAALSRTRMSKPRWPAARHCARAGRVIATSAKFGRLSSACRRSMQRASSACWCAPVQSDGAIAIIVTAMITAATAIIMPALTRRFPIGPHRLPTPVY